MIKFKGNFFKVPVSPTKSLGLQYMEQQIVSLVQNVGKAKCCDGQYTVTGERRF
jgi:hypothetical protein